MKRVLLILWQLPQVILGLLVVLVLQAKRGLAEDVWFCEAPIGVSFGPVIILCIDAPGIDLDHERGHSKQSLLLGPLYLLVVGLPSLLMNLLSWVSVRWGSIRFAMNYYRRWPESWADKLAGIDRSKF